MLIKQTAAIVVSNKPICRAILWAARAKAHDKSRPVLSLVHIEDTNIVCTNGKSLHVAQVDWDGFKVGASDYTIVKVGRSEICLLPNEDPAVAFPAYWQSVVPSLDGMVAVRGLMSPYEVCAEIGRLGGILDFYQVLAAIDERCKVDMYYNPTTPALTPIVLAHVGVPYKAVIMPLVKRNYSAFQV